MLCQNCQRKDAVAHLKRIVNGESAEVHLCSDCARALGVADVFPDFGSPFGELFGAGTASEQTYPGLRSIRCDICGFSFDDIARTGMPGCPSCYGVFAEKLRPMLRKLHGRARYLGTAKEKTAEPSGNHAGVPVNADTVLSSRVRFARNIEGIPFPIRLNPRQRTAVTSSVCAALNAASLPLNVIDMSRLYPYEAVSLAERHIISPDFAAAADGKILLLSEDERVGIMLHEGDHARIQAICSGLAPEQAYEEAMRYEKALDHALGFAFDPKLGYLNQNPRDIGTGMRVSVMMHLPALSKTGCMSGITSMISKLGISVRGSYGDGATVKGDLFRISNRLTMGITEEREIENLKSLAMQLSTKERTAAEEFVRDISTVDKIKRAEAVLLSAALLSADEMMEMLSWVRLGAIYGISKADPAVLNRLFTDMQPATLNVLAGENLTTAERDELRAKIVREKLAV